MTNEGLAVGAAPHVFEVRTASRSMWMISACLCAPIVQSSLSDGFASMLIAMVSVASALAAELVVELVGGKNAYPRNILGSDGSVVVSALVLALMMPNQINPAVPAAGAAFSVLVVKRSFGGLGSNWLNPAAGAWLFLRYTWPAIFNASLSQSVSGMLSSAVSKGVIDASGSPLAVLKVAGWKPSAADEGISSWLNDSILSSFGAQLPSGYFDLLGTPGPGLIAERGYFMLLCATVVLLAFRLVRWQLPLAYVLCYVAAARVWGGTPFGGALFSGDMLFALFSGGLALSAYVLIADPGTGCRTMPGNVLAAAAAGLLSFALYYVGGDPYGPLLAVPAVNLFAVLLRMAERRLRYPPRGRS